MATAKHLKKKSVSYHSLTYAKAYRPDHWNIKKINKILKPRPGEKILEVGCSKGTLVKHYRQRKIEIYGIDASRDSVALADSDFITRQAGDRIDFPTDYFDAVMGIHVIEHIPQLQGFLKELTRVVRPGGKFFFMYPAEPIQGLFAIYAATVLLRNPLKARTIHCHKLTPSKLRTKFTDVLNMRHVYSKFWFLPLPQFGTLLINSKPTQFAKK